MDQASEGRPKVLFMDDDPARGASFLAEYPDAVWVQTAEDCIAHLAEPWDEVHLDHDLGGDVFVDFERDDCGMAVVRWPCAQPARPGRLRSVAGRAIRWLRSGDKRRMAPVDDGDRVGTSEGHEPLDLKSGGPGPGGDR